MHPKPVVVTAGHPSLRSQLALPYLLPPAQYFSSYGYHMLRPHPIKSQLQVAFEPEPTAPSPPVLN